MDPEKRISFHILENAFDYVLSAAKHASLGEEHDWKYAILHLVAGIELLLKARLQDEHWSLLFQRVDQASTNTLESGEFTSVDFETSCNRLRNIANVIISESDLVHLRKIRGIRNRLQHFGIDIELAQVTALMARGINFTLDFTQSNLAEQLSPMEDKTQEIHSHLRQFQEFIDTRMEEIKPQLTTANDLLECPTCWQITLKIGDGEPYCPFCGFQTTSEELARELSETPMNDNCLECGAKTLCFLLIDNEYGVDFCTTCGTTQNVCQECGTRFIGDSEYCYDCQQDNGETEDGKDGKEEVDLWVDTGDVDYDGGDYDGSEDGNLK